jgi:hypothetical protein
VASISLLDSVQILSGTLMNPAEYIHFWDPVAQEPFLMMTM